MEITPKDGEYYWIRDPDVKNITIGFYHETLRRKQWWVAGCDSSFSPEEVTVLEHLPIPEKFKNKKEN